MNALLLEARPAGVESTSAVTQERLRGILRLLLSQGPLTVSEIVNRFRVSYATARRDAVVLAAAGRAVRRHGWLLPAATLHGEQHFRARAAHHPGAKIHLAHAAAKLLPHQGTVFVDGGTTCLAVGQLLLQRPGLTLVTPSIPLLAQAGQGPAAIIALGGEVRQRSLALTGSFGQPWMAGPHFDAAVVGAAGLDPVEGAFTAEFSEAMNKTEALRRSTLRLLVADTEKWRRRSAFCFAPWRAFSVLVTNQDVRDEVRARLAAAGVAIHLTGECPTPARDCAVAAEA